MINEHLTKKELVPYIEDSQEQLHEEVNNDEMPLCVKVGLGLLGATALGFGICKLLSRNEENIEINEDIENVTSF